MSKERYLLTDPMESISVDPARLIQRSSLFREFLAEHEEIMKHKWLESEKAGRDIGYDSARIDWILRHRANWCRGRRRRDAQRMSGNPPSLRAAA